VDLDLLDEKGVDPWTDVLTEERYRELFGDRPHPFTGIDYVAYYRGLISEAGCDVTIIFANDCRASLGQTRQVLCCDIHSRERTKRLLRQAGAQTVFGLDDLLSESVEGSGWNERFGLLGSNKATEESVKLFPRDCQPVVDGIRQALRE